MAKTYRVTFFVRLSNKFTATLLRAGVKLGNMALLTVRGRKSGLPRTTPVTLVEQDGQRWLIAPFGEVNWVRNLRAAREAALTQGRHSETISVTELTAEEAAPILKQSLARAPSFLRAYFDLTLPAINGWGFLVQRRSLPYEYCYSQRSGSFSPSVRFSEEKPVSECPPVRCHMVDKRNIRP